MARQRTPSNRPHHPLHYDVLTLLGCASVSFAGTALLFYVGMDWGRWVHMQAMCLMLLAIMLDRKAAVRDASIKPSTRRSLRFRATAALALFLYATTWTLPGVGSGGETPGYAYFVCKLYREAVHSFRISFGPNACYGPAPFAPIHYSRWLASAPGTLCVVRTPPLPHPDLPLTVVILKER